MCLYFFVFSKSLHMIVYWSDFVTVKPCSCMYCTCPEGDDPHSEVISVHPDCILTDNSTPACSVVLLNNSFLLPYLCVAYIYIGIFYIFCRKYKSRLCIYFKEELGASILSIKEFVSKILLLDFGCHYIRGFT